MVRAAWQTVRVEWDIPPTPAFHSPDITNVFGRKPERKVSSLEFMLLVSEIVAQAKVSCFPFAVVVMPTDCLIYLSKSVHDGCLRKAIRESLNKKNSPVNNRFTRALAR